MHDIMIQIHLKKITKTPRTTVLERVSIAGYCHCYDIHTNFMEKVSFRENFSKSRSTETKTKPTWPAKPIPEPFCLGFGFKRCPKTFLIFDLMESKRRRTFKEWRLKN